MYKVELWGGNINGGVRYYKSLTTARQQAKRYVTCCNKKFGLCSDAYAEIYKDRKLIESYE